LFNMKSVAAITLLFALGVSGRSLTVLPDCDNSFVAPSILPVDGATNKLPAKDHVISIMPVIIPENKLPNEQIISILPINEPSLIAHPIFSGSGAELVGQLPSIQPQPIFSGSGAELVGQLPSIQPQPIFSVSGAELVGQLPSIQPQPIFGGSDANIIIGKPEKPIISIKPIVTPENKLPNEQIISIMPIVGGGEIISILPVDGATNKLPAKEQVISIMPIAGGGETISILPISEPVQPVPVQPIYPLPTPVQPLPEAGCDEAVVPVFTGGNVELVGQQPSIQPHPLFSVGDIALGQAPSLVQQPIFGGSDVHLVGQQPSIIIKPDGGYGDRYRP
jgi:hypothetical protein